MNQPAETYRRRRVLIDRDFQLRFIGRFAGLLFFYLLLFMVISMVAPVGVSLVGGSGDWAMMETAFRVDVLLRMVLAPLVCTFFCLFVHGVLETFRVAGPNYRFRTVYQDLARGRLPRGVRIRRNDYLQEHCTDFDAALIHLHDRVAELKRCAYRVRTAVGAEDSNPAAREAVEALDDVLQGICLLGPAPGNSEIPEAEILQAVGPVEPAVDADATATPEVEPVRLS